MSPLALGRRAQGAGGAWTTLAARSCYWPPAARPTLPTVMAARPCTLRLELARWACWVSFWHWLQQLLILQMRLAGRRSSGLATTGTVRNRLPPRAVDLSPRTEPRSGLVLLSADHPRPPPPPAALAVERLLSEGADPWARDCNDRLPLHFAAEAGHLACVRALASWMRQTAADGPPALPDAAAAASSPPQQRSLDAPDQNGHTPVQLAAQQGHHECVAVLLDDASGSGEARRSGALHLAAARGLGEVTRLLLAPGARGRAGPAPAARDGDGWAPLHHAAAGGHAEVVQALLGAGSDPDDAASDGDAPLHKATAGGHLAAVRLLLAARASLDMRSTTGATPLYNAASKGHTVVARALAEAGAVIDAPTTNGCTPLYIAAHNGFEGGCPGPGRGGLNHIELCNSCSVRLLQQPPAWPQSLACLSRPTATPPAAPCAGTVAELLSLGANPDLETSSGCTALHAAALNGHAACVAALSAAGCDVDAQSQNGSSALHNAANGGHVAVVRELVAAGADLDVQNGNGNTPLHLAAAKGKPWLVLLLPAQAMLTCAIDNISCILLSGWAEIVDALLDGGADVHIRSAKGWVPIQSAANGGGCRPQLPLHPSLSSRAPRPSWAPLKLAAPPPAGWFDIVLRLVQQGAAWRIKGDADVARLLCKKSSYK